jgi:O-antigen/teichoic acid export membrane protein
MTLETIEAGATDRPVAIDTPGAVGADASARGNDGAVPLRTRAARGVFWTLIEYGGGEGIAFLVFLMLARVVEPADFGLISLSLVFVSFIQMFLVQGFADAVIQRETLDPDHCSTAFWTNLAIAATFVVLTLALADPIADLFHDPDLAPVLRWLSPLPLGTALISIHQAVFKRRLDFANFAKRAVLGVGTGGIVGIACALEGCGVWSLVAQQLTNAAVSVVVIWWNCEWRPSWRFSPRCFRDMAGFSTSIMGNNLVTFIYRKADVTLIGYFFDTHQLGYYYLVQRLLITMGLVTQSTIQSIVMPVLSRVQNDPARFREIFARAVEFLNAIWLPLTLGAGLVASLLLPVVFGAKWAPGVPLLEIYSLVGFTEAYTLYSAPALTAAGRPRAYLKLSVIQIVIGIALLLPATLFGLRGIVAADVLIAASLIPFHLAVLKREAGIEPSALLRRCLPAIGATLVMAITVMALKGALAATLPPVMALILVVLAGAAVYALALAILAPAFIRQIINLLATTLGRSAAAAS